MTTMQRQTTRVLRRVAGVVGALSICVVGASGALTPAARAAGVQKNNTVTGTITVSAAASLTDSFTALVKEFRKAHPQVRVRFNFASSSTLRSQIQSGAPVDVFASADLASQDQLAATGNIVSSPRVFARNTMQIAVKPGNPLGIVGVSDLSRIGTISLCGKTVPCGVYAASVLALAKVTIVETSITRGVDAKATLASVAYGDASAAIVYATDVLAAKPAVTGIVIPAAKNVKAVYAISLVRGTKNRTAAKAFIDFTVSANGQRVLRTFGFLAP